MPIVGLSLFLLSVPLGLAGLMDPRPARSGALLAAAVLAAPTGLLTAAL